MPDLDYAKVIGRFGLTVGDINGGDVDDNPDTIWCDEGRILIQPLITYVKVAGATPGPWTGGNAVIEATIDTDGHLTYHGKQHVYVVDLTSAKVNPRIGDNKATHRVTFADVKAGGTDVSFPSIDVRLVAAGDGVSPDGVNDLTVVAPVVTGTASPIYRGETGTGVVGAAIVDGGALQLELSDGSTVDAGELPVGPGGSDAGVAIYLERDDSETTAAVAARLAALDADPTSAVRVQADARHFASIAQMKVWARNLDQLIAGAITRDANGAATTAPVAWPDGTVGTYTADTLSTAFPGAVDAYHVTYGSPVTKTFTQPAVTRDATGAAANVPAIVVS